MSGYHDLKADHERLGNEGTIAKKLDTFSDYVVSEVNGAPSDSLVLQGYSIGRKWEKGSVYLLLLGKIQNCSSSKRHGKKNLYD